MQRKKTKEEDEEERKKEEEEDTKEMRLRKKSFGIVRTGKEKDVLY